MIKLKKIFALLSLIMLLFTNSAPAYAEAIPHQNEVQPLLDMVTSAAYNNKEAQEESSGNGLNQPFVSSYLQAAAAQTGNAALLEDSAAQSEFLKKTLVPDLEAAGKLAKPEAGEYLGMQIMTQKKMEDGSLKIIGTLYTAENMLNKLDTKGLTKVKWLDKRIVIGLSPDSTSEYQYKVSDISLQGELLMEEEQNKYFETHLVDYVNTRMGFSFQYPALFVESSIQETDDGISASNEKGTASMQVKTFSNTENWTAESFYNTTVSSKPEAVVKRIEGNESVSVFEALDDNTLVYHLYLFTPENVYQVSYTFKKELAQEFGLYIQYLQNTFQVLGTEIG